MYLCCATSTGVWQNGGRFRAKLQPIKIDNPTKRDSFYIHDSYKGESHGCIETETILYYFLLSIYDEGYEEIFLKVKYPAIENTLTYGRTDTLQMKIPKNAFKDSNYNINLYEIPIPNKPYVFEKNNFNSYNNPYRP